MIWTFFIVVGLGLVAVIAALVTSRLPYDPMSSAVTTANDPGLPARPSMRDVDGVRFDFALRGYRMDQVDDVLDALRDRLAEQDEVIDALRRGDGAPAAAALHPSAPEPGPEPEPELAPGPQTEPEREPHHLPRPTTHPSRDAADSAPLDVVDADAEGR